MLDRFGHNQQTTFLNLCTSLNTVCIKAITNSSSDNLLCSSTSFRRHGHMHQRGDRGTISSHSEHCDARTSVRHVFSRAPVVVLHNAFWRERLCEALGGERCSLFFGRHVVSSISGFEHRAAVTAARPCVPFVLALDAEALL